MTSIHERFSNPSDDWYDDDSEDTAMSEAWEAAHPFLIWSRDKGAFERQGRRGYTLNPREAGLFTFEETAQIVLLHIPPGELVAVEARMAEQVVERLKRSA